MAVSLLVAELLRWSLQCYSGHRMQVERCWDESLRVHHESNTRHHGGPPHPQRSLRDFVVSFGFAGHVSHRSCDASNSALPCVSSYALINLKSNNVCNMCGRSMLDQNDEEPSVRDRLVIWDYYKAFYEPCKSQSQIKDSNSAAPSMASMV